MKKLFVCAFALVVALAVPAAVTAGGPSPGHSCVYGKSLSEWMRLYWTWALGGNQPDHEAHVRFLEIPGDATDVGGVYYGTLDTSMPPNSPFVLPILVMEGEYYDDPANDDAPLDPADFLGADVQVSIDGHPFIDSEFDDLSQFYFGSVYFDEPFPYPEQTSYGADGIYFVQGIGFVHPPLSRGEHTIDLNVRAEVPEYGDENGPFVIQFVNHWNITVHGDGHGHGHHGH